MLTKLYQTAQHHQHPLSTEQTEERAWSVTSRCQGSNAKCPNWDDSMGWLSKEDWQHIPHIPAAYVVSQYWNKGLKVVGGQQLVSPILPLPLPPPPLPPPHLPTLSRRHQRKAGFLLPTWNWKLVLTKHNNSGPHNKLHVSVKIGTRVFPFQVSTFLQIFWEATQTVNQCEGRTLG